MNLLDKAGILAGLSLDPTRAQQEALVWMENV
jgi:hypothetical protein